MTVSLSEIEEKISVGINIKLSIKEWMDIYTKCFTPYQIVTMTLMPLEYREVFLGKPVIRTKNSFIIYTRCQWCGQTDCALDSNNFCTHCGGYLDSEQWYSK